MFESSPVYLCAGSNRGLFNSTPLSLQQSRDDLVLNLDKPPVGPAKNCYLLGGRAHTSNGAVLMCNMRSGV